MSEHTMKVDLEFSLDACLVEYEFDEGDSDVGQSAGCAVLSVTYQGLDVMPLLSAKRIEELAEECFEEMRDKAEREREDWQREAAEERAADRAEMRDYA